MSVWTGCNGYFSLIDAPQNWLFVEIDAHNSRSAAVWWQFADGSASIRVSQVEGFEVPSAPRSRRPIRRGCCDGSFLGCNGGGWRSSEGAALWRGWLSRGGMQHSGEGRKVLTVPEKDKGFCPLQKQNPHLCEAGELPRKSPTIIAASYKKQNKNFSRYLSPAANKGRPAWVGRPFRGATCSGVRVTSGHAGRACNGGRAWRRRRRCRQRPGR